jgi:hypothetical protein
MLRFSWIEDLTSVIHSNAYEQPTRISGRSAK